MSKGGIKLKVDLMSQSLNHKGTEVFKKAMTVHLYVVDTPDVHMPPVITKFFIYLIYNHGDRSSVSFQMAAWLKLKDGR